MRLTLEDKAIMIVTHLVVAVDEFVQNKLITFTEPKGMFTLYIKKNHI